MLSDNSGSARLDERFSNLQEISDHVREKHFMLAVLIRSLFNKSAHALFSKRGFPTRLRLFDASIIFRSERSSKLA